MAQPTSTTAYLASRASPLPSQVMPAERTYALEIMTSPRPAGKTPPRP
jgi:hypothetical protein